MGQQVVELPERIVEHSDVEDIALLADELAAVEPGHPARVTEIRLRRPGCSISERGRPAQSSGSERSIRVRRPVASDQSLASLSGSRRRRTWSMVHVTVATVGIPRRW